MDRSIVIHKDHFYNQTCPREVYAVFRELYAQGPEIWPKAIVNMFPGNSIAQNMTMAMLFYE